MKRIAFGLLLAVTLAGGVAVAPSAGLAQMIGQATPWIGIAIDVGEHGVLVKGVVNDKTPAAKAGLRAGDEVLSIDGEPVKKPEELIGKVRDKGVGTKVKLVVERSGKSGKEKISVELALVARPDEIQLLHDNLLDKPAPDFAPTDGAGPHSAKLADLNGYVVVVEFWATWCGPCRTTRPRLNAWQQKYGKQGLRVVGISGEGWGVIKDFAQKNPFGYAIAADPTGKIQQDYLVPAIPMLVIIDRKGVVRYVDVGAGSKLDDAEAAFLPLLTPTVPDGAK